VQPAAGVAEGGAGRSDRCDRLGEGDPRANEEPDRERGIPGPGTGQRYRDCGALGIGGAARQQSSEQQPSGGPDGLDGPAVVEGQAVRSSCPSRTPTMVETPGSCMVTP
jgi:hypothetical protein